MKRLVCTLAIVTALAGCAEEKHLDQDVTQLQQQQDTLRADIKKIQIVSEDKVKGHPDFTKLGRVEGFCFNRPNSTSGQVVHGDGIRAAANRKYGDQVDAIVNTTIWFVPDDASPVFEPFTENGYFECGGTAVRFTTPAQ
jgi:hypothetical protein